MKKELECTFKKKKTEYLLLERNERHYISIWLFNEQNEKKAALYAKYYLRESLRIEDVKSFSVHLQTIHVDKSYRRRGVGTVMIQALIHELLEVEREEGCEFVLIQGEIGNTGGDNPRLSKPFYRSLNGTAFGRDRKLVLELKANGTEEGLDCFCYYIL